MLRKGGVVLMKGNKSCPYHGPRAPLSPRPPSGATRRGAGGGRARGPAPAAEAWQSSQGCRLTTTVGLESPGEHPGWPLDDHGDGLAPDGGTPVRALRAAAAAAPAPLRAQGRPGVAVDGRRSGETTPGALGRGEGSYRQN